MLPPSPLPPLYDRWMRALERIVLATFADVVSETLPARLVLAPVQIVDMQPEFCRVKTYSLTDLLDLPRPLFETFRCRSGWSLSAAIRRDDVSAREPARHLPTHCCWRLECDCRD